MHVTGYKPGKPLASGDAATWTSGVVRVRCSFETASGAQVGHAAGSGFVLNVWPGIVLTARHVVVLPQAIPAVRMSVVIGAKTVDGFAEVDALGVAYPTAPGWDVAAILILGGAGTTLPLEDPVPADGTQVDGTAAGYVGSDEDPRVLASRVLRSGATLREIDKPSIHGMSGGPVRLATGNTGVFGIQSRDDHGQGIATVLDFDVLNDCARRAREFHP